MSLEQLQAQRQQINAEIQRRRAKGLDPKGFEKQLASVDAQLRQMRAQGGQAGATEQAGPIDPAGPPNVGKTNFANIPQAASAENQQASYEADKNLQLNNPNQSGPVGNREIVRDANGNITVKDSLSADQQKILDQDEAISQMGRGLASKRLDSGGFDQSFTPVTNSREAVQRQLDQAGQPFNPQLAPRTMEGDFITDRRRIEDEVFKSLTRNVDKDFGQARNELEQKLQNRGIPVGSKLYNDQMAQLSERFDNVKASAMGQAVQMGGTEMQRSFGMQEDLIGNQYNQQLGTQGQNFNQAVTQYGLNEQTIGNQFNQQQAARNQNLGEISGLANMGTGVLMPNFQAYQGAQFNPTNPFDIWLQQQGVQQGNRQLNIAQQQANRAGGGGGGGGQQQQQQSPFNNTPPPGL